MTSDDLFGGVADRLLAVLEEFGDDAFRQAALKASVAIARVALSESEERAGKTRPEPGGNVVRFPTGGRGGPRAEP